jgi:TDG/mug DNA glycosylase family protein
VLGIEAYRVAFAAPHAVMGLQRATIAAARVWVLPNPSGLNAHYQLPQLAQLYAEVR